jgi:hypothetical protein
MSSTQLLNRTAALQRRNLRNAWLCMLLGLLIPLLALLGAYLGWQVRETAPRTAWTLVGVGIAIFVVRLALYLG